MLPKNIAYKAVDAKVEFIGNKIADNSRNIGEIVILPEKKEKKY